MGRAVNEMIMVIICEKYKWTYQEYLEQPKWFIELIKAKEEIDNQKQAEENRKIKNKIKKR